MKAVKEPKKWRTHYEAIRRMRQGIQAPVDSMGCHTLADSQADAKAFEHYRCTSITGLIPIIDSEVPHSSRSYAVLTDKGSSDCCCDEESP